MRWNYRIRRHIEIAALLAALPISIGAQEPNTRGAILQRLEAQYVPTETTDDKSDIVTAGSILTLRKDNLLLVAISSGSVCPNNYKDGRITQGTMAKVTCGPQMSLASKRKIFLAGQKLWVTHIDVKDGSVVFELYTDAIGGERFRATLVFPFAKGTIPAPDAVEKVVAEVFKADPPPQPAATTPAPGTAAPPVGGQTLVPGAPAAPVAPAAPAAVPQQEAPLPPIDAPPPPPADPKTIGLGQTSQQVVASWGQPDKIVKLATKQIYYYKDLKVVFVNNKVSDVQ